MKFTKHFIIILLTIVSFGACKESTTTKSEKIAYQCPMKCEGDKTYKEAGSCPKCNMHLKLKEENKP